MKSILRYWIYFLLLFSGVCLPEKSISSSPELSVQTGHSAKITQLQFSHDGKIIGSLSEDNSVLLWDTQTGRQITRITQKERIQSFTFHPFEKKITLLVWPANVITINYQNDSIVQKKYTNNLPVKIISLPASGNYLVVDSNHVTIYDESFDEIRQKFTSANDEAIKDAHLSHDGQTIFLILRETEGWIKFMRIKYLRISDLSEVKLKPLYSSKTQIDVNASMAFTEDGKFFISQLLFVDQFLLKDDQFERELKYAVSEKYHNKVTNVCAFDGEMYAGMHNGDIQIYDYHEQKYTDVLKGHSADISASGFYREKNWYVTGDKNGLILLWDIQSKKLLHTLKGNDEQITAFSINKDETKMILGYLNGDLKYWDRITQEIRKINLQNGTAKALLGFNYVITDIAPLENDSVVLFDCSYAFSIRKNVFDRVVFYKGKWNIYTNHLQLTEIGNEFSMRFEITSPENFYRISYQNSDVNPHLQDSSEQYKIKVAGKNLILKHHHRTDTLYTHHQGGISKVKIIGDLVYTSGWKGSLKIHQLSTHHEIITMGIMGRSGFYYYLPAGYYYASKKSLKYLSFRIQDHVFPFDQFDMIYNRPDIVLDSISFIEEDIIWQFRKAHEKRKSRSTAKTIDENSMDELPKLMVNVPELVTKEGKTVLHIEASDPKAIITDLFVFINGVPETGIQIQSSQQINLDIPISLSYEMNNILVYVENSAGWSSLKQEINILNTQRIHKPDLYLITIGSGEFEKSGYNLNYALKDANDMRSFLKNNRSFDKVHSLHFENSQVTHEILNEMSQFLSPADEKDQIIVFYAGHGVLDKNYEYYLSTYSIDFQDPEKKGIRYSDLEKILASNKAREKLLLIDACHSGEIDKEAVKETSPETEIISGKIKFRNAGLNFDMAGGALELSKIVFANTENGSGIAVISSSGGGELAIEGEEWNNGLFTYAFLNGLKKKKADENNDGAILISEIQNFVGETVNRLSGGLQKPNARSENILNDFVIQK